MTIFKTLLAFTFVSAIAAACGDDTTSTPDGGVSPDAGASTCGTGTEHQMILNAPTTAQVIKKTPTHPPIGDDGLP